MAKKYVVVDASGHTSWDEKNDEAESFGSLDAAVERARELAAYTPGEGVVVYAAHCVVLAEVEAPTVKPW